MIILVRRYSRDGIAFLATNPTPENSSSGGGSLGSVISHSLMPLDFFRIIETLALVLFLCVVHLVLV